MVHVSFRVCRPARHVPLYPTTNDFSSDKITMWILPHDLRDIIYTQGWIFLACIVGTEILSMATPARFLRVFPLSRLAKMDHAAHLGGYFVGTGCGYVLTQRKREKKARESNWFESLVR